MDKVFLLHARAQSGKNTCANIMKEYYETQGKRVIIIAFADYVKFTLEKYYNITDFKSEEGRSRIQHYATDQIRDGYKKTFWAELVANYLDAIQADFDIAIIPDWRFENEYGMIQWHFGKRAIPVLITRPDIDVVDNMTKEQRQHQSETELDNFQKFSYNIINDNLDETTEQLIFMMSMEEINLHD